MDNNEIRKDMQDMLAEDQIEDLEAELEAELEDDDEAQVEQVEDAESAEAEVEEPQEIVNEFEDELGIISEDTRIEGDVESKGHLAIAGTVDGKVSTKGNVIVTGIVRGKIRCRDLVLDRCNLNAEIQATGNVTIKSGNVNGDITCNDLNIKGTVTGSINASGTIALANDAVVKGDIRAARMGMEIGAIVDGRITITR